MGSCLFQTLFIHWICSGLLAESIRCKTRIDQRILSDYSCLWKCISPWLSSVDDIHCYLCKPVAIDRDAHRLIVSEFYIIGIDVVLVLEQGRVLPGID